MPSLLNETTLKFNNTEKNVRVTNERKRCQDGQEWTRLKRIANNILEKFRVNFSQTIYNDEAS